MSFGRATHLKGVIKMEQKVETKKKIVKVVIWIVVVLALMGTMHILVNYFDIFEFLKKLHGA
jgi:hypothetical protein